MKTSIINYVDYQHSYAHALEPKLKTLCYHTFVTKKPVNYVRKIVLNTLKESDVKFTEKEQSFYDDIQAATTSKDIYYRCRNAVNYAKTVMVEVGEDGILLQTK